jgi:ABC-type Fe3+ transport system substrate-binding protein
VKEAPHPNAAKLYHDFLASEEGQKIAAVKFGSFSPRGLRPEGLPDINTLDLFLISADEMPKFTAMRKECNAEFKRLYMGGK